MSIGAIPPEHGFVSRFWPPCIGNRQHQAQIICRLQHVTHIPVSLGIEMRSWDQCRAFASAWTGSSRRKHKRNAEDVERASGRRHSRTCADIPGVHSRLPCSFPSGVLKRMQPLIVAGCRMIRSRTFAGFAGTHVRRICR